MITEPSAVVTCLSGEDRYLIARATTAFEELNKTLIENQKRDSMNQITIHRMFALTWLGVIIFGAISLIYNIYLLSQ